MNKFDTNAENKCIHIAITCTFLAVSHSKTHTHNRFMALWIMSGTTWVSRYLHLGLIL